MQTLADAAALLAAHGRAPVPHVQLVVDVAAALREGRLLYSGLRWVGRLCLCLRRVCACVCVCMRRRVRAMRALRSSPWSHAAALSSDP
jgi:hypothetical protein